MSKKSISDQEKDELLHTLQKRFEQNMGRHEDLKWADVESRLQKNMHKLRPLHQMETSGGEPDVTGYDRQSDEYIFCDCSAESPAKRRSLCFDTAALNSRKENKPVGSVMDMAANMGIELLDETQYRELQQMGKFDLKTSSWIKTPDKIRKLGGALFCDRRYDTVFLYHNGAESYYAARGFRGRLRV